MRKALMRIMIPQAAAPCQARAPSLRPYSEEPPFVSLFFPTIGQSLVDMRDQLDLTKTTGELTPAGRFFLIPILALHPLPEFLNAVVPRVGYVDMSIAVAGNRPGILEPTGTVP